MAQIHWFLRCACCSSNARSQQCSADPFTSWATFGTCKPEKLQKACPSNNLMFAITFASRKAGSVASLWLALRLTLRTPVISKLRMVVPPLVHAQRRVWADSVRWLTVEQCKRQKCKALSLTHVLVVRCSLALVTVVTTVYLQKIHWLKQCQGPRGGLWSSCTRLDAGSSCL